MNYISTRKAGFCELHPRINLTSKRKISLNGKQSRVDFGRVIFSGKVPIGFLYLSENLEGFFIFKETAQLLVTSLLIYLISTVLLSLWVEKTLTKPLIELVKVSEKISLDNNLLVRAKKLSNDEFGKLTSFSIRCWIPSGIQTNNLLPVIKIWKTGSSREQKILMKLTKKYRQKCKPKLTEIRN